MKAAVAGVGAALLASSCCIGPVVFSLAGAGAIGASAVALELYRPVLIGLTVVSVGIAFYGAYRPLPAAQCAPGICAPVSRRRAKVFVWAAAIVSAGALAFPYYIGWII